MYKTDAILQRDVIEELRWDPQIGRSEIGVAASDGVVTLAGSLDSYAQKFAALRAAARVEGTRGVADELVVTVPSAYHRTDTEIAHAAVNALRWDTEVPDDRVTIRVDGGWVWLEGEVDWKFQKEAAERSVRYLLGVKGVTDAIRIAPHASAPDVKKHIEEALKRSAEVDSREIRVEATDGHVTLRGKVRSWAEREDAERAAWSTAGVTAVEDELAVAL